MNQARLRKHRREITFDLRQRRHFWQWNICISRPVILSRAARRGFPLSRARFSVLSLFRTIRNSWFSCYNCSMHSPMQAPLLRDRSGSRSRLRARLLTFHRINIQRTRLTILDHASQLFSPSFSQPFVLSFIFSLYPSVAFSISFWFKKSTRSAVSEFA